MILKNLYATHPMFAKPAPVNTCNCGCEYGFDCNKPHVRKYPGSQEHSCEFCGYYQASRPRCNKCQKSD